MQASVAERLRARAVSKLRHYLRDGIKVETKKRGRDSEILSARDNPNSLHEQDVQ